MSNVHSTTTTLTSTDIASDMVFCTFCLSQQDDDNYGSDDDYREEEEELGYAQDIVVVRGKDERVACSDFCVSCPPLENKSGEIRVCINGVEMDSLRMTVHHQQVVFCTGLSCKPSSTNLLQALNHLDAIQQDKNHNDESAYQVEFRQRQTTTTTTTTTINNDNNNNNKSDNKARDVVVARANLFVWDAKDRVVVCDIDGTITKSNVRGVWDTIVMESYRYAHDGVCGFLSNLPPPFRILYLTSRPLDLSNTTRKFLRGLRQEAASTLPPGPLFSQNVSFGQVLLSELVWKNVHLYKTDTLVRQLCLVFAAVQQDEDDGFSCPLVAGFGNTSADTMAYDRAGIPLLYQINKSSRITRRVLSDEGYTIQETYHGGFQDPKLLEDLLQLLPTETCE